MRGLVLVALLVPQLVMAQTAPPPPENDPWLAPPGTTVQVPIPPPPRLTPEEYDILERGKVSGGQHVAGAIVAYFLGFGIGHAIQGRYGSKGWIFTIGDLASYAATIGGIVPCVDHDNCTWLVVGALGLVGFRVWEVVDAIVGPFAVNRSYDEVYERSRRPPPGGGWSGFILPGKNGGATAGISFSF